MHDGLAGAEVHHHVPGVQEFRAQLIIHDQQRALFQRSLELAQRRGKLRRADGEARRLRVALDTTNIRGRGAVKDTDNLLAEGIVQVARVLAAQAGQPVEALGDGAGSQRYVAGPSLKGEAEIDWADAAARQQFLATIVADADWVLEWLVQACTAREADGPRYRRAGHGGRAASARGSLRMWSGRRRGPPSRGAWRPTGPCRRDHPEEVARAEEP